MSGQNTTLIAPQDLIPQLLSSYEANGTNVSLTADDRQQLTTVLTTVAQFANTVGMYDVFKRYGLRIVFMLHHSPSLLEWLGPTSRYSPYIQSALMLLLLIGALAGPDPTQKDVDQFEAFVQKNVTRDRTLPTALIFMANMLNDLYNDIVTVPFKATQFDIDQPLIPETALLSTLATFRILQAVIPSQPTVTDNTKNIFRLFYVYYVDLQSTLDYTTFLNQHIQFLSKNANDPRLTAFYFTLYSRLCDQIKNMSLLTPPSLYNAFQIHPFAIINDFPDKICDFCQTLQTKNTDYATNLDNYVKDYRDIVSYVWTEMNEVYLLTQTYDPTTVLDINQFKSLSSDLLDAVDGCYFDSHIVPGKSILAFFRPGQALTGASSGVMGSAVDRAFGMLQNLSSQFNLPFLDMLNSPSAQNMVKMGLQNLNFNKILDNDFVKKYVSLDFDLISKGLLYFWKTFSHSSNFKTLAMSGDSKTIIQNFVGAIHDPAVNYIRGMLDKTPYGSMVNLPSIGKFVDVVLGQAKNIVVKPGAITSPIFTTGTQVVADIANNIAAPAAASSAITIIPPA